MSRPPIEVVVVTWNSGATIEHCLASLPSEVSVRVVDNASSDDTQALVHACSPGIDLVVNDDNRGFAAAVNQGLARTDRDAHVLVLNPDARLHPDALDRLSSTVDDDDVALVAPLIVDERGRPERFAGGREPSLLAVAVHELGLGRLLPDQSLYRSNQSGGPRDWVAWTAVLLNRSAIEAVGGLDESYFLYCEDIDWCRRARDAGWTIVVEPSAVVTHHGRHSVSLAGSWVDEHRIGSLDTYVARCNGTVVLTLVRAVRLVGKSLRAVVFSTAGLVVRSEELRARGAQRARDARLVLRSIRERR